MAPGGRRHGCRGLARTPPGRRRTGSGGTDRIGRWSGAPCAHRSGSVAQAGRTYHHPVEWQSNRRVTAWRALRPTRPLLLPAIRQLPHRDVPRLFFEGTRPVSRSVQAVRVSRIRQRTCGILAFFQATARIFWRRREILRAQELRAGGRRAAAAGRPQRGISCGVGPATAVAAGCRVGRTQACADGPSGAEARAPQPTNETRGITAGQPVADDPRESSRPGHRRGLFLFARPASARTRPAPPASTSVAAAFRGARSTQSQPWRQPTPKW